MPLHPVDYLNDGSEEEEMSKAAEESGVTKEEILQGVKETPDLKLW